MPSSDSPVHLVGHYIRQEDFDEPPSSDEEGYGSDEFDEDDMSGEDISGLIDMDDEEMDDEEEAGRIQEIEDAKPCVCSLSCPPKPQRHGTETETDDCFGTPGPRSALLLPRRTRRPAPTTRPRR